MKFEEKSPSLSSVSFELTALHQIIGAAGTLCPPPVVIGLRLAMTLPDEYERAALGEYSGDVPFFGVPFQKENKLLGVIFGKITNKYKIWCAILER